MELADEFFDLQLRFGRTAAALAHLDEGQALFLYTHLFMRLGCGRTLDPAHPLWRGYLHGLATADDALAWTLQFRHRHRSGDTGPVLHGRAGCFGYTRLSPGEVRIHYQAGGSGTETSPLAAALAPQRRQEIATLIAQAQRQATETVHVVGGSWLYHLPAYRRLFPAAYLATARAIEPPWQRMSLWGQVLDRHGRLRPEARDRVLRGLERARSVEQLRDCFTWPVLALRAPASVFASA